MFRRLMIASALGGAGIITGFLWLLSNVQVQGQSSPPLSFFCTPTQAAVFPGSRVHVRCLEVQPENISFFALSSDDSDAQLALSLAQEAIAERKQLAIFYNPDSSANPAGCQVNDCRKLEGIVLLQALL